MNHYVGVVMFLVKSCITTIYNSSTKALWDTKYFTQLTNTRTLCHLFTAS